MEAQQNNENQPKKLSALDALVLLRAKFIKVLREYTQGQDTGALEEYLEYYGNLDPQQLVSAIIKTSNMANSEMSIRYLTVWLSISLTNEQVAHLVSIINRMITICTQK